MIGDNMPPGVGLMALPVAVIAACLGAGPIALVGIGTAGMAAEAYNATHQVPWGSGCSYKEYKRDCLQ